MKKVLIIILGVLILLGVSFLILKYQTKKFSPAETASFKTGDFALEIVYCRPYKKGRLIFGEATEGALLPYGKYWRVGANEATQISFNQPINFGGKRIEAGKYNLYAYPDRDQWDIVLGSDWNRWGATEPSASNEVMRIKAQASNNTPEEEQFTITITAENITLHWDQTQVTIPFEVLEK